MRNLGRRHYVTNACIECRSAKLKCDGDDPCNRCGEKKLECTYRLQSKRGPKPKRKKYHQLARKFFTDEEKVPKILQHSEPIYENGQFTLIPTDWKAIKLDMLHMQTDQETLTLCLSLYAELNYSIYDWSDFTNVKYQLGVSEWNEYCSIDSREELSQFPVEKCVAALFHILQRHVGNCIPLPEHQTLSLLEIVKDVTDAEFAELIALCLLLWIGYLNSNRIQCEIKKSFSAEAIAIQMVSLVCKYPQNVALDLMIPIFSNLLLAEVHQKEEEYLTWLSKLTQIASKSSINVTISAFLRIVWKLFSSKKNVSLQTIDALTQLCFRLQKRISSSKDEALSMAFFGGKSLLLALKNQLTEATVMAEEVINFMISLRENTFHFSSCEGFGFFCAIAVFIESRLFALAEIAMQMLESFHICSFPNQMVKLNFCQHTLYPLTEQEEGEDIWNLYGDERLFVDPILI